MLKRGEVSRSKVLDIIKISVKNFKIGRRTYPNTYEEALVVASAEIEGVHGLPIDVNALVAELQLFIKAINARQSTKCITANSSSKYTRSVIKQVNRKEYGHDMQRKKIRTGLVKVSSIINNRARQSYPRLAWLMFHKIAQMYRDIREQEREEARELILNLCANLNSKNISLSFPITTNTSIQQPTIPLDPKTVPEDLKEI